MLMNLKELLIMPICRNARFKTFLKIWIIPTMAKSTIVIS